MASWRRTKKMKKRLSKKMRRRLYEDSLDDLVFELSLDPLWRQQLFDSHQGKRFVLTDEELARLSTQLGERAHQFGLRFSVFNEGRTPDGNVVFGFESAEYPTIRTFSTNNPAVI